MVATDLIAALVVARIQADRLVEVLLVGGRVETHFTRTVATKIAQLAGSDRFAGHEQFRVNVLDVPLERLAVETLTQLATFGYVTEVAEIVADALVVVLFEFVHPHLGQPNGIPGMRRNHISIRGLI